MEMQLYCAKLINSYYPKYTIVENEVKPFGGKLFVNWNSFAVPIRSRNVEILIKEKDGKTFR